ncbi:MAG TPA: cytochrome c [Verrucomicrobiae bacterium]|jgi:mono/diheme cytochrome c family protein
MRYVISILLISTAIGAATFGMLGWQGGLMRKPPFELFPDMDRQAKLRPQKPFAFFTNGLSSQLAPAGTIARSVPIETSNGPVYRFEDSPVNTGMTTGTTNFIENNPLPVTGVLLARGHERFDIYCAPCHGKMGDGNGITKRIGAMPAVANLHDARIVEMADGEIFNTVTHGKGLMGAYGPIVPAEDRWALIAYLRALQLSTLGSTDDLTPEQQAALNK